MVMLAEAEFPESSLAHGPWSNTAGKDLLLICSPMPYINSFIAYLAEMAHRGARRIRTRLASARCKACVKRLVWWHIRKHVQQTALRAGHTLRAQLCMALFPYALCGADVAELAICSTSPTPVICLQPWETCDLIQYFEGKLSFQGTCSTGCCKLSQCWRRRP